MLMIVGSITAKPDSVEVVKALLAELCAATRQESGCNRYDGHISLDEPNKFVFVERWKSQEAFDNHLKQPHVAQWRAASSDHVVAREVEIIHVEKIVRP